MKLKWNKQSEQMWNTGHIIWFHFTRFVLQVGSCVVPMLTWIATCPTKDTNNKVIENIKGFRLNTLQWKIVCDCRIRWTEKEIKISYQTKFQSMSQWCKGQEQILGRLNFCLFTMTHIIISTIDGPENFEIALRSWQLQE